MKLSVIATLGVVAFSPSAYSAQTVTCKFADPNNTDRLIVTLTDTQSGNLVYLTGTADDAATSSADGTLPLKRLDVGSKDIAGFTTQVEAMQMTFKMPNAIATKATGPFKASLSSQIPDLTTSGQDQDLNCDLAAQKQI